MGSIKTGIAIPVDLAREFEKVMKALGYESRSKAIRDAIQHFITMHRWQSAEGSVVGALLVVYNHGEAEEDLTDVQHEFLDIVTSAMHIHLTKELCLQIVAIRGHISRVKELYKKVANIRGVRYLQPAFFSAIM